MSRALTHVDTLRVVCGSTTCPRAADQRAWLFTTARNLMLRDGRDESRRRTLSVRVGAQHPFDAPAVDSEAIARVDLGRAW
jgi:DNA-directed RNA polymerase specialized sigma24 family protein